MGYGPYCVWTSSTRGAIRAQSSPSGAPRPATTSATSRPASASLVNFHTTCPAVGPGAKGGNGTGADSEGSGTGPGTADAGDADGCCSGAGPGSCGATLTRP